MANVVKGVVQKLWNKNKAWSIIIDDVFYGNGFEKPKCSEGDMVKFSYTENGKFKNIEKGSFEVLKEESRPTSAVKAVNVSKDDYWSRKEARDLENDKLRTLGASRNTAIAFVDLLLKAGAAPLPKADKDKAAAIEQMVEHYKEVFMFSDLGNNNNNEEVLDEDTSGDGDDVEFD